MKKILINILTHGNELVGKRVADEVTKRYPQLLGKSLIIQVANERAFSEQRRYIDEDLNRVFPGKVDGSYEERRAYELVPTISSYDLVVDIHSTESGSEDIIIVTKLDEQTLQTLKLISPKYVLVMNIGKDKALISYAKIGLALEFGKDADSRTEEKTLSAIEKLIHTYLLDPSDKKPFEFATQYFDVFAQIPKPEGAVLLSHIKNFSLIKAGETYGIKKDATPLIAEFDFYPVIFGQTNYETIFGFAAKLIR